MPPVKEKSLTNFYLPWVNPAMNLLETKFIFTQKNGAQRCATSLQNPREKLLHSCNSQFAASQRIFAFLGERGLIVGVF